MRPSTHSLRSTLAARSGPQPGRAPSLLAWALGLLIACAAWAAGAVPTDGPDGVHASVVEASAFDPRDQAPSDTPPSAQGVHDAAGVPADPPGGDSALVPDALVADGFAHAVDRGPAGARAGPDLPPPRRPPRG